MDDQRDALAIYENLLRLAYERIAALEAALAPFAERSESNRLIADVIAGHGKPCGVQPVPLEWLIRAAEVLAEGKAE